MDGTVKQARKFLFDTAFDVAARPAPSAASARPIVFSEAEVDAIRAEAYAAGHADGLAAAAADIAAHTSAALDSISVQLAQLGNIAAERAEEGTHRILAIVGAVFAKLFPEWEARQGRAEVEALIRACLTEFAQEPRLLVRAHSTLAEALAPHIDAIGRGAGFAGKIVLVPADDLAVMQVRVEWADGGVERDSARLWQSIASIFDRFVGSLPPPEAGAGSETSAQGIELPAAAQ